MPSPVCLSHAVRTALAMGIASLLALAPVAHAQLQIAPQTPPGAQPRIDAPLSLSADTLSPAPLPYLKSRPGCDVDILQSGTLTQHGAALTKGISLWGSDESAAGDAFRDAVAHLNTFSRALYCLDVTGLWFWDSAIADHWQAALAVPGGGTEACRSIVELWNPALRSLKLSPLPAASPPGWR